MIAHIALSIVVTALVMTAIGVGLLFGRGAPKGSCGGIKALGIKGGCEICDARERCPYKLRQ